MHFTVFGLPAKRLVLAAFAICLSSAAMAQSYPSRPVTIKAAFPAGGPADSAIRAANQILERNLGQTMVTENVAGAAGSIAATAALNAKADGYTILGTTVSDLVTAPFTIVSAKYQPESFKLLGLVGTSDFILVSSSAHSFKSLDELIAYATKPGNKELTIGHWGKGSTAHIVTADFQARTKASFLEVPYKGVAPVMADITGQHVDLTFAPLGGPVLELIKGGKVKAIALASAKRNPSLPDVPTISETPNLKNFEYTISAALFAPPGTPDPIVKRLNEAANAWIASPEYMERVNVQGSRQMPQMTVDEAQAFFRKEQEKFSAMARALKLDSQ
jgi:tripartite-type tricarboxylate transporter receptor subunit TctC